MLRFTTLVLLTLASIGTAVAQTAPQTWAIDPNHSSIGFKVRHMMISDVRGKFDKFTGTLAGDPRTPARTSIDVSIDTASVDTGVEGRDDDLRSDNFFDAPKYPAITFKSTSVRKASDGKWEIVGDMTMRGVTKPAVFKVEELSPVIKDPRGNERFAAKATTKINRSAWGVKWNKALETGGMLVSEEVAIELDLEWVRRP